MAAKKSYAFLFLWQTVTHVSVPFSPDINLDISNILSWDMFAESLWISILPETLLFKTQCNVSHLKFIGNSYYLNPSLPELSQLRREKSWFGDLLLHFFSWNLKKKNLLTIEVRLPYWVETFNSHRETPGFGTENTLFLPNNWYLGIAFYLEYFRWIVHKHMKCC